MIEIILFYCKYEKKLKAKYAVKTMTISICGQIGKVNDRICMVEHGSRGRCMAAFTDKVASSLPIAKVLNGMGAQQDESTSSENFRSENSLDRLGCKLY